MTLPSPDLLPNPGLVGGYGHCNARHPGGFCSVLVKSNGKLSRHAWVDSTGQTVNHKGPHRIEWR